MSRRTSGRKPKVEPRRAASTRPPVARPRVETELDRFFRLTLDLLCIAGFDGFFKRLNPAWENTLGWSARELMARPYIEFVHPDDRARTLAEAQKLAGGALTITFENRYRAKDGSYRWLQWNSTPVVEQELIFAAARDITERKQAEQALRESEEHTRLILDRAYDSFVAMDAGGLITDWNLQAERLFGWSRQEVVGRPLAEVLIPPRYREAHWRGLERYMATGEGPLLNRPLEMPALHRDGHEVPVELSVTPLRWRGRHSFYAFLRDISGRKALERMKDEFISMVSHELRTPLSSLRGALSMLQRGRLGALSAEGQRMLDIAVEDTDRLVRLTNDILDIERMEAGRYTLVKRACDAAQLVSRAVELMRPMAEKAEVALSVSAEPAPLRADPDRLLQALANLISNAVKFSPAGRTVWVNAWKQAGEAFFQVKDEGRGFPSENREAVFERFQQIDPSDSREKGATGLGLFITRNIVQQHGGRIWAESAPGQGSTFSFTLPLAAGGADEESSGG
ncbi:MAG: PAS domain S-box protein [Acidobacteria bacterium]|nr:PAS domain S-box protein [Acidobacteriota bacterium]